MRLLSLLSFPLCSRSFANSFQLSVLARSRVNLAMTSSNDTDATFGKFKIDAMNIFYRSEHSLAFVNLRPIVPGHVLVIPKEPNALLSAIPENAYDDLWRTVRKVQSALKDHYDATAFNVAVQDGRAARQTVSHAHVHN